MSDPKKPVQNPNQPQPGKNPGDAGYKEDSPDPNQKQPTRPDPNYPDDQK